MVISDWSNPTDNRARTSTEKDRSLVKLNNGTLVAFFAAGSWKGPTLRFRKSTDKGQTWTSYDGTNNDVAVGVGYEIYWNEFAVTTDGVDIYVTYYHYDATNGHHVGFCKITPSNWPGSSGIGTKYIVATDVQSIDNYGHAYPSIIREGSGKLWITYKAYDSGTGFLYIKVKSSTDGGVNWVNNGDTSYGDPGRIGSVANSSTQKYTVFIIWNSYPTAIYMQASNTYWRYFNGTTWSSEALVGNYPDSYFRHSFSSIGNTILMAQVKDYPTTTINYRYYNGSTWSSLTTIGATSSSNNPTVTNDGSIHYCFWYDPSGNVVYKKFDGTTWTPAPAEAPITLFSGGGPRTIESFTSTEPSIPMIFWVAKIFYFNQLVFPPIVTNVAPATGQNTADRTITITGTGFFGGITSNDISSIQLYDGIRTVNITSYSTISATTIINCIVPSGSPSGTYDVKVTNSGGTNSTSIEKYTITAELPTVTNVNPSEGSQSANTTVTITGTNFFGGTLSSDVRGLKLDTTPSETNIDYSSAGITDTTISGAVVPAGISPGTYNVKITTGGGTNATSSVKFTVKRYPVVNDVTVIGGTGLNTTTTTISITGSNFFAGGTSSAVTAVKLDDYNPGTSLTFSSSDVTDTTITNVIVPTGVRAGVWNVRVTTSDGTNSISLGKFTATANPPLVSGSAPDNGVNINLTTVTITGSGFFGGTDLGGVSSSDVKAIKLSTAPTETDLNYNSATITDTSISAVVIPTGITVGTYNIKVTTGGGTNSRFFSEFSG